MEPRLGKEYVLVEDVSGERRYQFAWTRGQNLRVSDSCLRVPTAMGVVIMPDMTHRAFGNYQSGRTISNEKPPGDAFDLPTLEEKLPGAETSGVMSCGVFAAECSEYKFMMHTASPIGLRALVGRGLDLAQEHGADLSKTFSVRLYTNSKECGRVRPTFLEGETSYAAQIQALAKAAGLDFATQPREVDDNGIITV